jgi:hypothetical protein
LFYNISTDSDETPSVDGIITDLLGKKGGKVITKIYSGKMVQVGELWNWRIIETTYDENGITGKHILTGDVNSVLREDARGSLKLTLETLKGKEEAIERDVEELETVCTECGRIFLITDAVEIEEYQLYVSEKRSRNT